MPMLVPLVAAAPSIAANEITVNVNGSTTTRNAGDPITVTLSGANDTVKVYSTSTSPLSSIGRITIAGTTSASVVKVMINSANFPSLPEDGPPSTFGAQDWAGIEAANSTLRSKLWVSGRIAGDLTDPITPSDATILAAQVWRLDIGGAVRAKIEASAAGTLVFGTYDGEFRVFAGSIASTGSVVALSGDVRGVNTSGSAGVSGNIIAEAGRIWTVSVNNGGNLQAKVKAGSTATQSSRTTNHNIDTVQVDGDILADSDAEPEIYAPSGRIRQVRSRTGGRAITISPSDQLYVGVYRITRVGGVDLNCHLPERTASDLVEVNDYPIFEFSVVMKCEGDFNHDCAINTDDLVVILGDFGASIPCGAISDINGDLAVNTTDLSTFLGSFGTECGGDCVPALRATTRQHATTPTGLMEASSSGPAGVVASNAAPLPPGPVITALGFESREAYFNYVSQLGEQQVWAHIADVLDVIQRLGLD